MTTLRPETHTMLSVVVSTVDGRHASNAACLAGEWRLVAMKTKHLKLPTWSDMAKIRSHFMRFDMCEGEYAELSVRRKTIVRKLI